MSRLQHVVFLCSSECLPLAQDMDWLCSERHFKWGSRNATSNLRHINAKHRRVAASTGRYSTGSVWKGENQNRFRWPKIPRDWTWPFKFTRIIHIVVQEETTHTAKLVFLAMLHATQHMPRYVQICGNHVQCKGGTLRNTKTVTEFGCFVGEHKWGLWFIPNVHDMNIRTYTYYNSIYFLPHVTVKIVKRPTGCWAATGCPSRPLAMHLAVLWPGV